MAAFAGFLIGLGLGAALLRRHRGELGWSRVMTRALLVEEGLLVAFAALWHLDAGPSSDPLCYGLIALSAVAMDVQSTVAHRIGGPDVMTTYLSILERVTRSVADRNVRRWPEALSPPHRPCCSGRPNFRSFLAIIVCDELSRAASFRLDGYWG